MSSSARFLACLLAPLLLAGCGGAEIEDPIYEIPPDEYMVVMPFDDPDLGGRWESPRAHDLGKLTTIQLDQQAEFGVRPYEKVIGLFAADDVAKLGPRDVAALTRADYVLVCDLERFDLQEDKHVNFNVGHATAKVRLFKVERRTPEEEAEFKRKDEEYRKAAGKANIPVKPIAEGGRFVCEETITTKYPNDYSTAPPDLKPSEIQDGLMQSLARKVAKLWYAHEKENIDKD
jgi:hypothetical protein